MKTARNPFRWGTLDSYVLRRFAGVYLANLACFSLLFVLVDAIEHLDDFTRAAGGVLGTVEFLVRYYLAVLPLVFCQLLGPIICLTTGLFTVTLLERANEITPILASGRSYHRVFVPVFLAGVVVTVFTFGVQELYIPTTVETIREVAGKREVQDLLEDQKYYDRQNGLLIVIYRYDVVGRRAEGVAVFPVGREREERLIRAQSMTWQDPGGDGVGYWLLEDAVVQSYHKDSDEGFARLMPHVLDEGERPIDGLREEVPRQRLTTTMIPEDLELSEDEVLYMTLGDLRRKMDESLDRRWVVKYFSRFAYPAHNLILLLLGLPAIVMLGGRNIFFGTLVSASLAAAYFVASSFFADVALRGFLPATLGAGLAPMLFGSLGLTLLRALRS